MQSPGELPLASWTNASLTGFLSNLDIAASPLRISRNFVGDGRGRKKSAALYITYFCCLGSKMTRGGGAESRGRRSPHESGVPS